MAREWIADVFGSDRGYDLLRTLVDVGPRLPGSEGERAAADHVRDALAAVGGRDVRIDEYDIVGWARGQSELVASESDDEVDCLALPRSPATDATGRLRDLGWGLPEDFGEADIAGDVVMVASGVPDGSDRYVHRNEKYAYAVSGGAAGFVFRSTLDGDLPTTGSVGTPNDPVGEIPAVAVSKEVGLRLARRHGGDRVRVGVNAEIGPATSRNVHAEIGPQTDERLLLTSHLDAHDLGEGAVDNGTGTGVVLEVFASLAAREDILGTRIEAVVFGSEEINLVGSSYEAERRSLEDIAGVVNLDGMAQSREIELYTHGFSGLREIADRVSDRFDHPITCSDTLTPYSDHWPFVREGVPGSFFTSASDRALRGWGHTHGDTLDKVDVRDLREQAILVTEYVTELARDESAVAHRDRSELAEALVEEGYATGMRVVGTWPYDDADGEAIAGDGAGRDETPDDDGNIVERTDG